MYNKTKCIFRKHIRETCEHINKHLSDINAGTVYMFRMFCMHVQPLSGCITARPDN